MTGREKMGRVVGCGDRGDTMSPHNDLGAIVGTLGLAR